MDAILLCAGLGTRLRPHTLTTPKPLLPIQGRPILDWTLGALPKGVDRVIVVTHYLGEQIDQYLQTQRHFTQWTTVPQGEPRGTGDALRRCQGSVRSERFLVLNGDDLFGAGDLADLAERSAGVLCAEVEDPSKYGIVFLKPDGTLSKLVEKPDLAGPLLANTGAYLLPRHVFDIPLNLSPRGEYEITDYITELASRQPFHVVRARFWMPIGTEAAWRQAEQADLSPLSTIG